MTHQTLFSQKPLPCWRSVTLRHAQVLPNHKEKLGLNSAFFWTEQSQNPPTPTPYNNEQSSSPSQHITCLECPCYTRKLLLLFLTTKCAQFCHLNMAWHTMEWWPHVTLCKAFIFPVLSWWLPNMFQYLKHIVPVGANILSVQPHVSV